MNSSIIHPPAATPATLATSRRGYLTLRIPSLRTQGPAAVETIRSLARCIMAIPSVQHLTMDGQAGTAALTLSFSASRKEVLRKVAHNLRQSAALSGESHPAWPDSPNLLPSIWVDGCLTLHRCGQLLTSWKIRRQSPKTWMAQHPLLQKSPALRTAVRCFLQSQDGVERVRVDPLRGRIWVEILPNGLSAYELTALLEQSLVDAPSLAHFLPPTPAGAALDVLQVCSAVALPLAPPLFFLSSTVLLMGCYAEQVRQALRAARAGRCDWNTVVTAVVALTVIQTAFLPAALMSLALRSWRWLEHRSARQHYLALSRLVLPGNPSYRPLLLGSAKKAQASSSERAETLANQAAAPTLAAAVVGLVFGGTASALAAVRPDQLTASRAVHRLSSLATLRRLAEKEIFLPDLDLLTSVSLAHTVLFETGMPMHSQESQALEAAGFSLKRKSLESLDNEGVLYFGRSLPPAPERSSYGVLCVVADPGRSAAIPGPHISLPRLDVALLLFLHREACRWRHDSSWATRFPLFGNGFLTVGGALFGWPSWGIAIATNVLTATCWLRWQNGQRPTRLLRF